MICILTAGKTLTLAAGAFTLAWTHSVEKTRWEEHWIAGPEGLTVTQGAIEGSGAGMDADRSFVRSGSGLWNSLLRHSASRETRQTHRPKRDLVFEMALLQATSSRHRSLLDLNAVIFVGNPNVCNKTSLMTSKLLLQREATLSSACRSSSVEAARP